MKYRTRTYYTAEQKAEIWDRWKRGEFMSSIGRKATIQISRPNTMLNGR